jgi:hypothetical protein
MREMNGLALALLIVAAGSPAAAFGGERVAPPVVRKTPPAPAAATPAGTSPEAYYAALTASAGSAGGDPVLDRGLMTTMSRLMAAGRCPDAIDLATRGGRAEVAGRARQLCGRH